MYVPDTFRKQPWPQDKPVKGNEDEYEQWRGGIGGAYACATAVGGRGPDLLSNVLFTSLLHNVVHRDILMAFSVNDARNDEGCRAKAAVSTILFRAHQNSTI